MAKSTIAGPGRPPGRKKGIANKPKRALIALLDEKFPGWHPVVQMAEVANNNDLEVETRFNAAKEVAKYVTPLLKSVEVDVTSKGESLNYLSTPELLSRVYGLIEQTGTLPDRDDPGRAPKH